MSSKKKRKSSCPFASANRADVLATRVIQSKIDGRTIPLVLAGRKLKARQRRTRRTGLPRVVTKVGYSNNCCQRSPARKSLEICFLSVLSCICDFVGECFCKVRATFMLDRVLSKRGLPVEDCAFFWSFSPFEVVTSWSISARVRPRRFPLFTQTLFPCLRHLSSCFIRRNVNPH